MSHLDFSEDDIIDSLSTCSNRTEPPPVRPPAGAASPTNSSLDPIQYARSSKFYYADLIEVSVRSGRPVGYLVPAAFLQLSTTSHFEPLNENVSMKNSGRSLMLERVSSTQMEAFLEVAYMRLNSELPGFLKKHGNEDVIVLPFDVRQSDWEIFLEVVTARPYDDPPLSLSFPEWVGGLRVAKFMQHADASNYIRTEIETKFLSEDVVDLLEAAIKLEFPDSEWLRGRFAALADRERNISAEEILRLGAKATETVCRLREQAAYERGKAEASELEVSVSEPSEPEFSVPGAHELEVSVPVTKVQNGVVSKKASLKKGGKKR
ncbi:hypothetical protein FRC01_001482 [Tulasnella sp. 417]|nr:hypothetical protein FRC01_001482 [Tulasnella sp. 417]